VKPLSKTSRPTVWHRLDYFLARLRPHREPLSLAVDGVLIAISWNVTYLFRIGFDRWFDARPDYDVWVMLGIIAIYLSMFAILRVPQSMWRFSGFGEVKLLAWACLGAGLACAAAVMGLQLYGVPRSVLALHPLVTLMSVCMVRIGYRMLYEHSRAQITGSDKEVRRALILGAGQAGQRLLAGIHQQGWVVLGMLDDDPVKQGARIAGVPVLGPLEAVSDMAILGASTHIIIALPGASARQRRRAFELASAAGLPVLTVPSADELRAGSDGVERLRDIEPEDLLGRETVKLDEQGIDKVLHGKTVLITGGGGSIGSELCRQAAHYGPARLVLLELSEFNLYTISQEFSLRFPDIELIRLIGDVKDLAHVQRVFETWRPTIVFHAAAYKHVPLMEEQNAWSALRNNTLGTYHAALASAQAGVERFILISTDKAVNPTNVMGATKRAAEMVVSSLALDHPGTRFIAVRFGNVLGSSGSVIPKFKEQIARGGPVTVTHPDIIRYFMTIPEAARLVIQAAVIGESGQVLVLDMGDPVKIVDLARNMIRLSGRSVDDIPIVFSGLRPGEKLYEELLADADATIPTSVPKLRVAQLQSRHASIGELLGRAANVESMSDVEVRVQLAQVVPEYRIARH
jgi:FlaA1/EpsC-like NDP-sugar epimerase